MYRLIIISIFHFGITTLSAQKYAPIGEKIMSEWGEKVTPKNVWQEYPRPQFEREKWMNLNGLWDYTIQPKKAVRPSSFQGKTLVPFCVESVLSGVGRSWALRPCGEIYDIHSYQTEVHVPPLSREMASVLGEYGGIGYPIQGHLWNPKMRNWGYQNLSIRRRTTQKLPVQI